MQKNDSKVKTEIWQQFLTFFLAFSSRNLGLKMKQYYANIFSSENFHWKKNLKIFSISIFPKVVSRAQKLLKFSL